MHGILGQRFRDTQRKPALGAQLIAGHPQNQALYLRWLLNEGGGSFANSGTGLGLGATLNAAQSWGPDGLVFNGSTDELRFTLLSVTTDFTMIVRQATTGDTMFFSHTSNNIQFRLGQAGGNVLSTYDGANNPQSSVLATTRGIPNTVAYVRSGTTMSFFENGVARGTGTNTGTLTLNAFGRLLASAQPLNGTVYDAALYLRALTQDELMTYSQAPYAGVWSPSRILYSFAPSVGGATFKPAWARRPRNIGLGIAA